MNNFETALLAELRQHVAQRNQAVQSRKRFTKGQLARWGVAVLPAGAAAAVSAALLIPADNAYAVTPHNDGSVTVTIKQLQDATGLQQELRADGVNAYVSYNGSQTLPVPAGTGHPAVVNQHRSPGTPSGTDHTRTGTAPAGGGSGACQAPIANLVTTSNQTVTFTIPADLVGSQNTLDISTTASGASLSDLQVRWYC